ncbi:MAG: helix-turn-helix domain-containing protein [Archaeoglobaceae archaeon]
MWEEYSGSIEDSREYHERYHRAVNHPIRRRILKLVSGGIKNLDEIAEKLKISREQLEYHVKVLEWGFCVERRGDVLELTKEGEVVEHLD